jgi:hypothetical protein
MTRKRVVLVVCVALLGAGVLLTALSVHAWHGPWRVYDPAGTWINKRDGGGAVIVNITPCDPAGHKCTLMADVLQDRSWLYDYYGIGPVAAETKFLGYIVKTGRNTYLSTDVAYGVDADFNILYWVVCAGTVVQTGPDTIELSERAGFYTPDQDPFGDEPPAIGSWPETSTYRRVPIVAPPGE